MAQETLYLKLEKNIELSEKEVLLKDAAKMTCTNTHILAKCKALKLYNFKDKESRVIISVMKIIELIQQAVPNLSVESIGETDVVAEYVDAGKRAKRQWWKIILVSLMCLVGTAFTILTFHNDISIHLVFRELHRIITGDLTSGYSILEIMYSIGLALGMIIFFNHIGGRKITKDPTPIEVAMKTYEDDVNKALVATAEREENKIDVD